MFSSNQTNVVVVPNYIEDVFSTYLYTGVSQPGNSSAYGYLVNNIDLLTKGGMIWTKDRSTNASGTNDNVIVDTLRGTGTWPAGISNSPYMLKTNTTAAQVTMNDAIQGVTTTGYYIGPGNTGVDAINTLNNNYASWTFRKQPKFFDVVTYTGNGSNRSISHNLGSTPGFVIVKRTDTTGDWYCNIVAFTGWTDYLVLNSTAARATDTTVWNSTSPTSTTFSVGTNAGVNANGGTYVAYLFATDAGGFGLTGTDNVIKTLLVSSAGSGNTTVNLGFEPQFLMFKKTASTSDWFIYDTMRGMAYSTGAATLLADTAGAETTGISVVPTATGFVAALDNSFTYFCLAIRRGPMKVPTTGTSVYNGITRTGTGAAESITGVGFTPDFIMARGRTGGFESMVVDRLRGNTQFVKTDSVSAEGTMSAGSAGTVGFTLMDGMGIGTYIYWNDSGTPFINHFFKRAPSFFDEVCYAGSGSVTTQAHNLGAVPEMMIHKARGGTTNAGWAVYVSSLGAGNTLTLNNTNGVSSSPNNWNSTAPTSSVFTVGTSSSGETNYSGTNYVAYLFATLAGVSKVGSYTGNGTTQAISCGFTGGARFVLIKRTDAAGDWYVYDTARGMTTLTDPYLLLDDTAAETATLGSVTTTTGGFTVNASILSAINTNAATYIFLAIA